jgi:LPXTG-site transpeptidase (sortase) family protein
MKGSSQPQVSRSELIALYRSAVIHGVSLDEVEEKISDQLLRLRVNQTVETTEDTKRVNKWQLPKFVRMGAMILPIACIAFGLYLVGTAALPIFNYYVWRLPEVQLSQLVSPIPQEEVMEVTPLVVTQVQAYEETTYNNTPRIIDIELDYTNLNNWFQPENGEKLAFGNEGIPEDEYTIDIPKLNVSNAVVKMGGTDLNKSLIAYPGTAKPGEMGAPVVFGHSVLRQFYNPSEKNSRRYNSIFSTIMTLKNGDEIFVTHDGVKYTYIVQEKTEVKPTDVYILAQQYDAARLKLVTCTPEGTYLRRGVVTAQLVSKQ